jgi:hypothetical protein
MGLVATARANMPADQRKPWRHGAASQKKIIQKEILKKHKETSGITSAFLCFLKNTCNTKKKHFRGAGRHANKGKVLNKAGEEEKVLYVSCEL